MDIAEKSMPNVAGLHSARAFLLDRAWRFREARSASEKALRDNPNDPDTSTFITDGMLVADTGQLAASGFVRRCSKPSNCTFILSCCFLLWRGRTRTPVQAKPH